MTAHVLEHLALTLVLAPALAAGFGARVPLKLPPAIALAQFAVVAGLVHLPAIWDATQRSALLRVAADVVVLASATVFWRPALERDGGLGGVGRAVYLLIGMPAMSYVGVVLFAVDRPLYAGVSVAAQQRAGALMWGLGSFVSAALLVWAVWTALQSDERRAVAREALS